MTFSDNFGKLISAHFAPQATGSGFQFRDINDVARNTTVYGSHLANKYNQGNQCTVQVGKGLTPATRQDFNIEDPFIGGAESIRQNTGFGGWNSGLGQVDIPTVISPTAGSGSISETVLYNMWHTTNIGDHHFLMSRDNISPIVSFISGKAINVDYKLLLG